MGFFVVVYSHNLYDDPYQRWTYGQTDKISKVFTAILCLRFAVMVSKDACSGVGSNYASRGPLIQVVGVALITEFCDHNIPFI